MIVNVFNAQMTSSMKQLEVRDPVVKSIVAKQVGSSVKSVIELVNPDIAYTPSTSTDPYQILVDIWHISPKTVSQKEGGELASTPVPGPVKKIDIEGTAPLVLESEEMTMDSPKMTTFSSSDTMPGDMPAQLQWFSEKLSQVLQEREKIKQDLFEVEKSVAVKDSMIQVLERKVKEANNHIVELEEEMIKVKSTTSLVEQNERAMRRELQVVLDQLEGKIIGQSLPAEKAADGELQSRSQEILTKITALQEEKESLSLAHDQVGSLNQQLDSLLAERDELRVQNETLLAEVDSLKGQLARFAAVEQQLHVKEQELYRIRQAVGVTAPAASQTVVASQQPKLAVDTSSDVSTLSMATEIQEVSQQEDTQLVLENLIQQQMVGQGPSEEYILGPDDMIQIKVLNEDNLDKSVTVSSDGFITYPLLGDLRVDGLTTAQLDAQITTLLEREYLVNPEVLVDVIKPRSKKVYIMGMVKQPGYHEIQGDHRLLGTMLNAGGPTSFATEVRILRLPKGELEGGGIPETLSPIVVDLNRLFVDGRSNTECVAAGWRCAHGCRERRSRIGSNCWRCSAIGSSAVLCCRKC